MTVISIRIFHTGRGPGGGARAAVSARGAQFAPWRALSLPAYRLRFMQNPAPHRRWPAVPLVRISLAAALPWLAASCESWRFQKPVDSLAIRTPGSWVAASKGNQARIATGWMNDLGDRGLSRAVDEALERNQNLKATAARLREVRQSSIVARARQLPSVGISGDASFSESGIGSGNSVSSERYGLSLSASWEPDLWGRLGDLTQAAEAEERAAIEDFRGARLSLAANTAKSWCNLISAQQEVRLAELTLESFEKNFRIIERIYRGTGEGALDIQFGRTNVSSARRALEQRKLELAEAARSLELLLGRYPGGLARASRELPEIRGKVPAGIPAGILERRPDLAAARDRMFASARRADASRKALLPSTAITGNSGTSTIRLADLLNPEFLAASIGARFSQIITEGGAISADARAALARNEAQVHQYAQLALQAFREVESALAAEQSLAEQEVYLRAELEQATLAERQAERDYSEGFNPNILSVLEAQRRANNARASMIRLQNQRLQNRIDLYLALGGDFRTTA